VSALNTTFPVSTISNCINITYSQETNSVSFLLLYVTRRRQKESTVSQCVCVCVCVCARARARDKILDFLHVHSMSFPIIIR